MQNQQFNFQDRYGNAIAGALVSMFYRATGLPAPIYSDNGTTLVTALYTDALGEFNIYAADGRYSIALEKEGVSTKILPDVQFEDPAEGGGEPYLPPGVGAVASNVKTQLDRVINAANYTVAGVVNSVAINAAITQLTNNGGGICYLPPGYLFVDAPILITKGVILQGAGTGSGTGTGNSGGTVLRSRVNGGDVITVQAEGGVVLRDFKIDKAAAVVKDAGTTGIRIQGLGGAGTINRKARVQNVQIFNMYDGIVLDAAADAVIDSCYVQDHTNHGIYLKQTGGTDIGHNTIANSVIWDQTNGASVSSICYAKGGDLRLIGNKLIGSDKGLWVNLDDGETGSVLSSGNSFEQQRTRCVEVTQAVSGKNFKDLTIQGSQFSIVGFAAAANAIKINTGTAAGGTSTWIKNVNITGNVCNMSGMGAGYTIDVLAGDCVTVAANTINNNGTALPVAMNVAAACISAKVCANQISNTPGGTYSDAAFQWMVPSAIIYLSSGTTVLANSGVFITQASQPSPEASAQFYLPYKAALLNMQTRASVAPGVGQTFTYTVRVNGVATALTAATTGSVTDTQNRTNVVRIPSPAGGAAAARISVMVATSASAAAALHTVIFSVCQDD